MGSLDACCLLTVVRLRPSAPLAAPMQLKFKNLKRVPQRRHLASAAWQVCIRLLGESQLKGFCPYAGPLRSAA